MKHCAQITVTPRILDTLRNLTVAHASFAENSSLIEESKKEGISGEMCRAALINHEIDEATFQLLIAQIEEALEVNNN